MHKTGFQLVLPEFAKEERKNLPALTCSPASTLSVESDTEDLSSDLGQELTPTVPRLKRISSTVQGPRAKKIAVSTAQIQPSSVDVKSFKFPVSPELKKYVKKGEPIPENLRCELIRECVTCLKAQYGEAIPNDAFKMASKLICAEVPELADVQPPNWPEGVKFEYWTSVLYTLKKRYMNIKHRTSGESSKSKKGQQFVLEVSEKDSESLLKELVKEVCGKRKKKEVNWESVKKLQRLTFSSRKKNIEDIDITGNNVVSAILEKFPFLDNEACLWNELELYVSEQTDEEVSVEILANRWENIAKCFVDGDLDKDDICSAALERMPKTFNAESSPLLHFLSDQTQLDSFLKTLRSNDPQLVFYQAEEVDDPSSIQRFIVVDKEVLLECQSLSSRDALISLLSVHFALNLRYNSNHMFMFKFIEEHVLGIVPKRKTYAYRKIENALLSKLKD